MAVVSPFAPSATTSRSRAARRLVAPPYDVIVGRAARGATCERSPYNVVHLTLPDSGGGAGATSPTGASEGVLRRGASRRSGALEQDYVGPDGVARTRAGSSRRSRSSHTRGQVLPHERTHAGPKEGRLRLLRATRTQLEPIFLLYDGPARSRARARARSGGRGRRSSGASTSRRSSDDFDDKQLLIADGHHRYETAVAFREEDGPAARMMLVVLVSTATPGSRSSRPTGSLAELNTEPEGRSGRLERARSSPIALRGGAAAHVPQGRLDVAARRALEPRGRPYTPTPTRRIAAVDAARRDRLPAARRHGSRTCSPSRGAARCCRRRRRTSSRSSSAASPLPALTRVVTAWLELCREAVGDVRACSASCRRASSASPCSPGERVATTRRRSTRLPSASCTGSSTSTAGLHARLGGARRASCGTAACASSSTRSTAR